MATGSSIKKCDCNHKFQDSEYGYKMRVMNATKTGEYKCTVCGKKHK